MASTATEGGCVAALLGTSRVQNATDAEYAEQDSGVQAVVDMSGFNDLTDFSGSPSWVASIAQASRTRAPASSNSPLQLVAPNDPPFLIAHGTDDWFIAPHHSQKLADRLQAAGVPTTLIMVQHDHHGIAAVTAGETEEPSPESIIQAVADFFTQVLGSATSAT